MDFELSGGELISHGRKWLKLITFSSLRFLSGQLYARQLGL